MKLSFVKKPGGASNRAGDLTGDEPLEDQRSLIPSASVDYQFGSLDIMRHSPDDREIGS